MDAWHVVMHFYECRNAIYLWSFIKFFVLKWSVPHEFKSFLVENLWRIVNALFGNRILFIITVLSLARCVIISGKQQWCSYDVQAATVKKERELQRKLLKKERKTFRTVMKVPCHSVAEYISFLMPICISKYMIWIILLNMWWCLVARILTMWLRVTMSVFIICKMWTNLQNSYLPPGSTVFCK